MTAPGRWSDVSFLSEHRDAGLISWLLRIHWRWVALSVVTATGWRMIELAIPYAVGRAVDEAVIAGDARGGVSWIGIAILLGGLIAGLGAFRHWVMDLSWVGIESQARMLIYRRALTLDLAWHRQHSRGDLLSRMNVEARRIALLLNEVGHLAGAAIGLVVLAVVLVRLSPPLMLVALPVIPLVAGAYYVIAEPLQRRSARLQERSAALSAAIEESLDGIEVVKTLGAERQRMEQLSGASESLRDEAANLERLTALIQSMAALIPTAAAAAGLWIGGRQVVDGSLSIGELTAFMTWMGQLTMMTRALTSRAQMLVRIRVAAQSLEALLHHQPALVSPEAPRPLAPAPDLRLREVTLTHGERHALDRFDLDVPYGSRLAIVGPTGSGKSTLAALLGRFVDPSDGVVEIGGATARSLDVDDIRRTVGVLFDEAVVFSGSIRENVDAGRGLPDEEIWEALRLAALADFVERLPEGLSASVGPGGRDLSGGQRQRLALARVLAGRPTILVLDEPTSALDESTERAVVRSLSTWPGTLVMITHRTGALAAADEVVLLHDGRAAGRGRHGDLVERLPAYRHTLGLDHTLGLEQPS